MTSIRKMPKTAIVRLRGNNDYGYGYGYGYGYARLCITVFSNKYFAL